MTDHYEMPHRRADECWHAGVGKACRPCCERFERDAMRERVSLMVEHPYPGNETQYLAPEHYARDVPRLLDALDTAEAEAKAERQRDRLRAREEQVRRLRAEVTRLHALVADMRAATSPAWDEDTVRAEVDREALRRFVDSFCDDEAGEVEHVVSADGTSGFAFTGGNDAHAVLRKAASALWPDESR